MMVTPHCYNNIALCVLEKVPVLSTGIIIGFDPFEYTVLEGIGVVDVTIRLIAGSLVGSSVGVNIFSTDGSAICMKYQISSVLVYYFTLSSSCSGSRFQLFQSNTDF